MFCHNNFGKMTEFSFLIRFTKLEKILSHKTTLRKPSSSSFFSCILKTVEQSKLEPMRVKKWKGLDENMKNVWIRLDSLVFFELANHISTRIKIN